MNIEIEKKYRLTRDECDALRERLRLAGANRDAEDFEENVIYAGGSLNAQHEVLRLRRTERGSTLTYKKQIESSSAIKQRREEETKIENADAMHAILTALGYAPAIIYEKRRETWSLDDAEIVIDELAFGHFAEIEAEADAIIEVERKLNLENTLVEHETYPALTAIHGVRRGALVEARLLGARASLPA